MFAEEDPDTVPAPKAVEISPPPPVGGPARDFRGRGEGEEGAVSLLVFGGGASPWASASPL